MRRLNALRSGHLFYSLAMNSNEKRCLLRLLAIWYLEIDFYSQLSNEGWKLVEVREESTNNEHIEPL